MILHRFFSDLFDRMLAPPGPPLFRFASGIFDYEHDAHGPWFVLKIAPRPDLRAPEETRTFATRGLDGFRLAAGIQFYRWTHLRAYWLAYSDAEEITTRIARNAGQIG